MDATSKDMGVCIIMRQMWQITMIVFDNNWHIHMSWNYRDGNAM
jgi:hypothetical protein